MRHLDCTHLEVLALHGERRVRRRADIVEAKMKHFLTTEHAAQIQAHEAVGVRRRHRQIVDVDQFLHIGLKFIMFISRLLIFVEEG